MDMGDRSYLLVAFLASALSGSVIGFTIAWMIWSP